MCTERSTAGRPVASPSSRRATRRHAIGAIEAGYVRDEDRAALGSYAHPELVAG